MDEFIIQGRLKGSAKWCFLISFETNWWGHRRNLAKRFPERKAMIIAANMRRRRPAYETTIAPARGPAFTE